MEQKQNQNQIGALEDRMKEAYADRRFAEVEALAVQMAQIDPENHIGERLLLKARHELEKAKTALVKADQKPKKPGLLERLKAWNQKRREAARVNAQKKAELKKQAEAAKAEKNKTMALKKQEEAKVKEAKKMEEEKTKTLKTQEEAKAREAKKLAEAKAAALKKAEENRGQEQEKQRKEAEKIKGVTARQEEEKKRRAHAEEINRLQDLIKKAYGESQLQAMEDHCQELVKVDPGNKIAAKFRGKVEDAKKALAKKADREKSEQEKRQKEAMKPKKPGLLERLKAWSQKRREAARVNAQKKAEAKKAASAPKKAPVVIASQTKPATVKPMPVMPVVAPVLKTPVVSPIPAIIPVAAKPAPAPMAKPVVPVAQKTPALQAVETRKADEKKGNIFTNMFGQKAVIETGQKKSIIDTIVARSGQKEGATKDKKADKADGVMFLRFAGGFLQFSLLFIALSSAFFYVYNIDAKNRVLNLVGVEENYASRLHAAAETLKEKKEQEKELKKEIERYEKGYSNRYEEVIAKIRDNRLNWPDILKKINEVTNAVYERNELSQYVTYDSFSFDAEKRQVRVSGNLSDPLGKNLTKLAELEQAFRNYPRDPNDPDDKTEPYFAEVKEFNSLQKTFNRQTGKYQSSFQLSFVLQK